MKINFNMDRFVLVIWLSHLMLNIVSYSINLVFGGVVNLLFIWLLLGYFVFFYKVKNNIFNRCNLLLQNALIVFVLFITFYVVFYQFLYNDPNRYYSFGIPFSNSVWNLTSLFPQVISSVFILVKADNDDIKILKKYGFIFTCIVFVISIIYLIDNPNAAKLTATSNENIVPLLFNYGLLYSFAIIFPFLWVNIICTSNKIISLLFIVLVVYGIYKSSYFIAVITVFLGSFLFVFLSIRSKIIKVLLTLFVLILLSFFVFSGYYEKIIISIIKSIDNVLIKERLSQLLDYFNSGEIKDSVTRLVLYFKSFKNIIQHPILGNILFDSNCFISGHSTLLDLWNGCGFFVLLIYLSFLFFISKINNSHFTDTRQKKAYVSSTVSLFFVSLCNPILASPLILIFWILFPRIASFSTTKDLQ